MTRNETVNRHGSTESSASWRSIRSNDTVRPFGGRGSLRGTPVTVQTSKDASFPYVHSLSFSLYLPGWLSAGRRRNDAGRGGRAVRSVRLDKMRRGRLARRVVVVSEGGV